MKPEVKREYYEDGALRYEEWFLNDKLHREDGPAFRSWHPDGTLESEAWWLNGKLLSKKDIAERGIDFILEMHAESLFDIYEILELTTRQQYAMMKYRREMVLSQERKPNANPS